jgi:hypothetical protein
MDMSEQVKRCTGCGHNFYRDAPMSDGRCKYCHKDDRIVSDGDVPRRVNSDDDLSGDEIGWDDAAI